MTAGPDVPDLGIDRREECDAVASRSAIFERRTLTGSDNNLGTMASPKLTILGGVSATLNVTPNKAVFVSKVDAIRTSRTEDSRRDQHLRRLRRRGQRLVSATAKHDYDSSRAVDRSHRVEGVCA